MYRMKQTSVMRLAMFTHIPCDLYSRNEGRWANAEDVGRRRCGNADQNKRLTAEEVLAARKEAQSRRYVEGLWSSNSMEGLWYAVVFKQKDCWRPTRWETPSAKAGGCWEILPGDRSQGIKEWIQGLHPNCIQLVPTSFSCSERRQRDYESEDSLLFSNHIRRNEP